MMFLVTPSMLPGIWQRMFTLHMLGGVQITAVATVVCTHSEACKTLCLTDGECLNWP